MWSSKNLVASTFRCCLPHKEVGKLCIGRLNRSNSIRFFPSQEGRVEAADRNSSWEDPLFFSQKIQFIGKAARAIWRRCHVHDCPVALQHWPQSGGTGGSWEQVGMPVEGRPHQVQEVGVACHFDERSEWLSRLNLWQTSSWSFFSPPKPRKTYAPKSGWKQSSPFLGSVEYNIWSFTAWLTIFGGGILTGPREKYEINSSLLLLMVQIAKTRTPVLDF